MKLPLILGLNPAWQRLFVLQEFCPGHVHRLPIPQEYASGKGINVARVLHKLGTRSALLQFAGGQQGIRLLNDLQEQGIAVHNIAIAQNTRICTTLTDSSGLSTELIESSPALSEKENLDFSMRLQMLWEHHDRIALCGTAPNNFDWKNLSSMPIQNKRIYLDAVNVLEEWMTQGVHLLKINSMELGLWLNKSPSEEFSPKWGQQALERWNIKTLVVTQGAKQAWAFCKGKAFNSKPPQAHPFVNSIGAGDAFLAAWIHYESSTPDTGALLGKALAIASKRCTVKLPWDINA